MAEKYEVSKSQVQKIFEQNNVIKLVRPVKKRKHENNSTNSIKEFSGLEEMARFAMESPDKNISKELFHESHRKCLYYKD